MKPIAMFTLAWIAAAGLALPAQAQMMPGGGGYGQGHTPAQLPPMGHPYKALNTLGHAEDLRLAGHCDEAVPILRRIVESPRDSAIATYNLGKCYLDLAPGETRKSRAAALRKRGAQLVLRAANHGFNEAQKEAVLIYLDGLGVAADPVEAEKWAIIYRHNPMRFVLHLPKISSDVRDRLDNTLTDAQQDEAEARADAWHRTL